MEKFGEINLSTLLGTLALLSVPCIPAALLPGFLFPLLRVLGAAMGLGLGPGWGRAGAKEGLGLLGLCLLCFPGASSRKAAEFWRPPSLFLCGELSHPATPTQPGAVQLEVGGVEGPCAELQCREASLL